MGITCGGMVLAGALYLIGAFVPCTDYRALREGPLKVCSLLSPLLTQKASWRAL